MRLEELFPEKWIYSLGSCALLLAGALFASELLRPALTAQAVSAHAGRPPRYDRRYPAPKQSPFLGPSDLPGEVLVKLPALPAKYQKKIFYVFPHARPSWRP